MDGVIERADQALYDAKMMGKNQVIVAADTTEHVEEETRKLFHFLSLFSGDGVESELSEGWQEEKPLREISGKGSAQRRSQ